MTSILKHYALSQFFNAVLQMTRGDPLWEENDTALYSFLLARIREGS